MTKPPTCETCRCFEPCGSICRRNPPTPVVVKLAYWSDCTYVDPDIETRWPVVGAGDWCGEHRPNPPKIKCGNCNGCGTVAMHTDRYTDGFAVYARVDCPICGGTGTVEQSDPPKANV